MGEKYTIKTSTQSKENGFFLIKVDKLIYVLLDSYHTVFEVSFAGINYEKIFFVWKTIIRYEKLNPAPF